MAEQAQAQAPAATRSTVATVHNGVVIDATFAEAFGMRATRIIVTAHNARWAMNAGRAATGFATSVIACGCEAGIERELSPDETPDGRPGVSLLLFAMSAKELGKQLEKRVGQCVLTCPTTAVYAGLPPGSGTDVAALGRNLRFFGDGWQIAKVIDGQRYWRIPVMDGEFLAQESTPVIKSVGGGNLLLLARDTESALAGAEAAVAAMLKLPSVVMPFPGGVVRSGSKVGSKYPALMASTNDAFCPSLTHQAKKTELDDSIGSVMEIVIDGLSAADVAAAMAAGLASIIERGASAGVLRVSAGNYGGKLGPHHFHLQDLLPPASTGAPPGAAATSTSAGAQP
ncbi:MAG: formylmethanofuran--tetrahydromethanopterin N-formyltransferase FhcD [Pseudomonadota bacterium]|jgi:formylmethanofuran--tetrahydromethanopterin N-formyltransferase